MGVSSAAASISLAPIDGPLLPIVVACYRSRTGDCAVVWDASTGAVADSLSVGFTQCLGWVGTQVLQIGQPIKS